MPDTAKNRFAYIDWMRGLACVLMFQTHCYNSWLGGAARDSKFSQLSQLGGTLPAPLFLFLAGVSVALVTDRARQKNVSRTAAALATIRRGGEIFILGLLFRVQEFVLGQPWAPWTDLLRVDVLNIIGLSIVLMGVACWFSRTRTAGVVIAAVTSAAIALATPPLWTTWRLHSLPWFLESYINGVHTFDKPQVWLFPIFPWTAFAFAGLAAGFLLFSDWARKNLGLAVAGFGVAGVVVYKLALWFDASPRHLYAVYDFWHTSPNFFLARVGVLFVIITIAYAWSRWGLPRWIFSPLTQLGQTSLLVYWVHIEFVYGRFSILPKHSETIPMATLGLAVIFTSMVLLSLLRTKTKGRGAELWSAFRRRVQLQLDG
jgi:uncharacterized membrane protein